MKRITAILIIMYIVIVVGSITPAAADNGIAGFISGLISDSEISDRAEAIAEDLGELADDAGSLVSGFLSGTSSSDVKISKGKSFTAKPIDSKLPPLDGSTMSFIEAMDRYEAFFDEYIAFIEKYNESDDTIGMLTDYVSMLTKAEEAEEALDAVDESNLTPEEDAYYLEVMLRINNKLYRALDRMK